MTSQHFDWQLNSTSHLSWYFDVLDGHLFPLKEYEQGSQSSKEPPKGCRWRSSRYSREQIEAYIEGGHSIAWAIGPTHLVVDVEAATEDGHQVDGREAFSQLCEDFNVDLRQVPAVSNPNGGRHYYFAKSPGHNFVKKLRKYPGIDFLREGQYVVIAGCRHWQGGRYQLDAQTSVISRPPSAAPDSLIDRLQKHSSPSSTSASQIGADVLEVLLNDHLDPVEFRGEGGGTWQDLMMACHSATAGGDDAFDVFRDWCFGDPHYCGDGRIKDRWDSCRPDGGITVATLLKIIQDRGVNVERAFTRFNQATAETDFEPRESVSKQPDSSGVWDDQQLNEDELYPTISTASIASVKPNRRYHCERILQEGKCMMVVAPEKTLKTTLMVDLGVSLTTGTDFLGVPEFSVPKPVNVLMMVGETEDDDIHEMTHRIARAHGADPVKDLSRLTWTKSLPAFGNDRHIEALKRLWAKNRYEVVVVDPFYLCITLGAARQVNHYDIMSMGPYLNRISRAAKECGVTLIGLHHTRKADRRPWSGPRYTTREDISGAGFAAWMRQWLLISRLEEYEGDGRHHIQIETGGFAHSGKYILDVDEGSQYAEGGRIWDVAVEPVSESLARQKRSKAIQAQAERTVHEDQVRQVIRDYGRAVSARHVYGKIEGLSQKKCTLLLDGMVAEGKLVVEVDVMPVGGGHRYDGYKINSEYVPPNSPSADFGEQSNPGNSAENGEAR